MPYEHDLRIPPHLMKWALATYLRARHLDVCQKLDAAIHDLTIAGECIVTKGIMDLKDESLNPWPLYIMSPRASGGLLRWQTRSSTGYGFRRERRFEQKAARFKRRKWC
jgi:hypothetical protein